MKHRLWKRILSIGLVFSVGTLFLSGCGKAKEAGLENNRLHIALQPTPSFLPVKLLSDNGWVQNALKEAGYTDIEVSFTEFESGPPENEAFAAGQQDIGVMGNVPTISGIAAGQKRTIIGIAANGVHTQGVVVKEDSDIAKVEDLNGKKVGLVVGSISQDLLDKLLKSVNLSTEDVELVNLSTGEQPQALENGNVDAVVTWNPTLTKIQSEGIGKLIADGEGVYLGENTIFAQSSYLKEHREIVEIFLEQYAKAVKEILADKEKFAEQYADSYGLSKEVLLSVIEKFEYPLILSDEDLNDLQGTADFLYENKIIGSKVNVSEYSDTSFNELLSENLK